MLVERVETTFTTSNNATNADAPKAAIRQRPFILFVCALLCCLLSSLPSRAHTEDISIAFVCSTLVYTSIHVQLQCICIDLQHVPFPHVRS